MIRARILFLIYMTQMMVFAATAADYDLDKVLEQGDLHASIVQHSERTLLKENTAVEQARAQAQSRSEYGLELRPRISDDEVGAALRIYLPSRWNKSKLGEQLVWVAQEEQLRVSSLEWNEIIDVYRLFCEYRMLNKQREMYARELALLEPHLENANSEVELNQLAVVDRAKLFSFYLDLVNDHEKLQSNLLGIKHRLYLLVGPEADLDRMAMVAVVEMPSLLQFDTLLQRALEHRSDYKLFDIHARSMAAAEAVARSEDGFRLKYIQPDVKVDYSNGETSYGLSASFVLPWGTRNPDIAVFQQQKALALAARELQRQQLSDRLRVLIHTSNAYYAEAKERSRRVTPLLEQLNRDLMQMETGRIEELRDLMLVRERILDVALQTARAIRVKEQIAVDIAEELGTFSN